MTDSSEELRKVLPSAIRIEIVGLQEAVHFLGSVLARSLAMVNRNHTGDPNRLATEIVTKALDESNLFLDPVE